MIPLIAKLTATTKKIPGGPIVQGVVALAFLLVAYLAIRAVVRGAGNALDRILNPPVDPDELAVETPTQDGTELNDPESDSFALTAEQVANAQHNALNGNVYPATTGFLFALLPYNGAQLQEIYSAYGVRQGKNLFERYNQELHSIPTGFATDDEYDGQVPGCESSLSFCSQRTFTRNLWQKSGLPITF
jgi:hypothetical protein